MSTEDQNLAMQVDALTRAGCIDVLVEKVSASAKRRPVLEWLLNHGIREGDTVVVWKMDRLARSMTHMLHVAERIKQAGASFRSLTEQIDTNTPGGIFLFHMLAAAAQLERDLIRERTNAGVKIAKERGVQFGQPHRLTWEQRRDVKAWKKADPKLSVRRIGDRIASEFGQKLSPTTIANYLNKPLGPKPKRKP